jgi:hypothetical protein
MTEEGCGSGSPYSIFHLRHHRQSRAQPARHTERPVPGRPTLHDQRFYVIRRASLHGTSVLHRQSVLHGNSVAGAPEPMSFLVPARAERGDVGRLVL